MLDKKDLEEITRLFKDAFAQVWEHNLEPAFNDIFGRLKKLEQKVDELPTKEYLNEKMAKQEARFIHVLIAEDDKLDRVTEILYERDVLNKSDMKELENFEVFSKKRKSS